MSNWYSLHVMSGKESTTRDKLLARAMSARLWQNSIFDILIPTEKEYVTKRGKRQVVDKKVFPGYIFVKMMLDEDIEKFIYGTDGVVGFVKTGSKPAAIPDAEIQEILKKLADSDGSPKSNFKVNDIVKIVEGPFSDFPAKIEHVDESKGKVKAFVNIFGRDTSVELDIKDIQPVE